MAEKRLMTQEGYDALKEELDHLVLVRRPEIVEKIKEAKAQGDLSENAEYDAARDEQAANENRIAEVTAMLEHVEIITADADSEGKIHPGSKVVIYDIEEDEEEEYSIVGFNEVDILNNKISNESPMGMALIGHEVGDVVEVTVENNVFKYEVKEIR